MTEQSQALAVQIEGLAHAYGQRPALRGITFSVNKGEIFGLLGPNGGGKTTLFRILSTLLKPTQGKATIFDFLVILAVVVTAVGADLMSAAGVGVGFAILLFLREQIRSSIVRRTLFGNQTFSKKRRLPDDMAVLEKNGGQTAVIELQGPLFFGTADQLFSEMQPLLTECKS